ncbi:MAG: hypothetical protein U1E96_11940 [Azonexus sp.]
MSNDDVYRPRHAIFRFRDAELLGHELLLRYALAGGHDPDIEFEERILLPQDLPAPDISDPTVQALVDGCHRAFGVSYFKAAIPPQIEAVPVCDADGVFWDTMYSEGMGEFYCRNGLSPVGRAAFPRDNVPVVVADVNRSHRGSFILIGGGKDSALVADIARHAEVPRTALSLGESPWIRRSAEASGLRLYVIRRTLDQKLFDLNARGAWNGHVPISACIAFVSMLVAYSAGIEDVIVGNERGAEDHNVVLDDIAINHQWSKTLKFEKSFRAWCDRHFRPGPRYFSLLRPMSEIHIAEKFAMLSGQLSNFTSCNTNFRLSPGHESSRWCGHCPKCIFVYLLLSPHLNDDQLHAVFGSNFLADDTNIGTLRALLGLDSAKPWECVGTADECRLSFIALMRQCRLPTTLTKLAEQYPDALRDTGFAESWRIETTLSDDHCLPREWKERLDAYL